MKKDADTLSANAINKFTYCPYQWYYEKKYGAKVLREKRKVLLDELGLEDATDVHFISGSQFHQKSYAVYKLQKAVIRLICFLAIVLALYGVYFYVQP